MKQLNYIENLIFRIGGILMVVGAAASIFPLLATYAPLAFALGAACYASMQLLAAYDGRSIVIRRLRRQQILSDVLLLLTAALLMMHTWRFGPLRGEEWKLTLAVAAVIQVYTAFRLPHELKKEQS